MKACKNTQTWAKAHKNRQKHAKVCYAVQILFCTEQNAITYSGRGRGGGGKSNS